jgi:putative endonuclease
MKHVVYILYSHKKDRYYIGSTSDEISERIRRHNTNHSGFTGGLGDWVLMYIQEFDTVEDARKREFQIKKWKSRKLIEALISKAQLV